MNFIFWKECSGEDLNLISHLDTPLSGAGPACLPACQGAPDEHSFEHFLPWIYKIMLTYQDEEQSDSKQMLPQGASFSKGL